VRVTQIPVEHEVKLSDLQNGSNGEDVHLKEVFDRTGYGRFFNSKEEIAQNDHKGRNRSQSGGV